MHAFSFYVCSWLFIVSYITKLHHLAVLLVSVTILDLWAAVSTSMNTGAPYSAALTLVCPAMVVVLLNPADKDTPAGNEMDEMRCRPPQFTDGGNFLTVQSVPTAALRNRKRWVDKGKVPNPHKNKFQPHDAILSEHIKNMSEVCSANAVEMRLMTAALPRAITCATR